MDETAPRVQLPGAAVALFTGVTVCEAWMVRYLLE